MAGIDISDGENIAVRDCTVSGGGILVNSTDADEFARNVDIYGCDAGHFTEDALEMDSAYPISVAIFHNRFREGSNISFSASGRGPYWLVGNHLTELLVTHAKHGAGTNTTGKGHILAANNTFVVSRQAQDHSNCTMHLNGRHSGVIYVNNIIVVWPAAHTACAFSGGDGTVDQDRINYWHNNLWHNQACGKPLDQLVQSRTLTRGAESGSIAYLDGDNEPSEFYRVDAQTADGSGNTLDFYLEWDLDPTNSTTGEVAKVVEFRGRAISATNNVYAWNWSGGAWDKIGEFVTSGATGTVAYALDANHTDGNGLVRIRFQRTTAASTGGQLLYYAVVNHSRWQWGGTVTNYRSPTLLDDAWKETEVTLTGTTVTADYPVDEDGFSLGEWESEDVPGVTNIAAKEGDPLPEPIPLGYFDGFSYEEP